MLLRISVSIRNKHGDFQLKYQFQCTLIVSFLRFRLASVWAKLGSYKIEDTAVASIIDKYTLESWLAHGELSNLLHPQICLLTFDRFLFKKTITSLIHLCKD
jgi:hypothetical protein